VECVETPSFRALYGGALVLIKGFERYLDALSQRIFYVLLASVSLVVYAVRGAEFRKELWGDDLELFIHANNRPTPTGVLGRIDYFGLFDSYNNYLIVWIRAITHLAMFGPDSQFTWNAYIVMTVVYAIVISYICFAISTFTSRKIALLALGFCVFLPFSNLVILAQVNTVIWPCALLMIVMSATRAYPKSKAGMTLLAVLFVVTSISTLTVSIALAILVLNFAQDLKRINKYELVLFCLTSLSFVIQWSVYEPRTNPKLPITDELHKALFNFSPQFIRGKIGEPLDGLNLVLFWAIPISLLLIWVLETNIARRSGWLLVLPSLKLFGGACLLLYLLIHGNGWLNTHYLFIPVSMFWISLVLLFHVNRHKTSTGLVIAATSSLFAATISGVYFLL
jgi:hypothetical protein